MILHNIPVVGRPGENSLTPRGGGRYNVLLTASHNYTSHSQYTIHKHTLTSYPVIPQNIPHTYTHTLNPSAAAMPQSHHHPHHMPLHSVIVLRPVSHLHSPTRASPSIHSLTVPRPDCPPPRPHSIHAASTLHPRSILRSSTNSLHSSFWALPGNCGTGLPVLVHGFVYFLNTFLGPLLFSLCPYVLMCSVL